MFELDFAFDSPWYLLLLLLLPVLWVLSFKSLSGLGKFRRLVAIGLRTVVLVIFILAVAETQFLRTSDKLTVIYLLDLSESIPAAQRDAMLKYVIEEVAEHRNARRSDRAGVIAFGRDAAIEVPPFDDDVPSIGAIESLLEINRDATNLTAALKLAQATFPEDSAKRVVIVTDGNENLGDARATSRGLAEAGIGIDIVPIQLGTRAEVAVEKVTIPSDVRKGQPFDVRVVLNNLTEPTAEDSGQVKGRLVLVRKSGASRDTTESEVVLEPGKKVLAVQQEIDQSDFYTYEAEFFPDNPNDDLMAQNNQASAFTHVRGQGQVLLIEDWKNKGEFDFLVDRLRARNLEVTVQSSDRLFSSLAELQRYGTVILANVPRSSGADADTLTNFSDAQLQMLVRNTQQMGSGTVMIGGENSFGAGGWANTALEKAMPVDFQIKSAKVMPVGALVLVMHASEMPRGNHWQKVVSREAIKMLGPQDYCGVVHWQGGDTWLWNNPNGLVKVGPNRKRMMSRLDRMTPGDMPAFDPSMKMAVAAFNQVKDAAVKHMIIISDGDPSEPRNSTIRALKNAGAKVSTVAVGTHGRPGAAVLEDIATATGGKYYVVNNPNALPRIYQKEARRIARPLVYEEPAGLVPQIEFPHEMVQGIEAIPPITGFVLTEVKDHPLVEVSLVSLKPAGKRNATILASWTYGAGKTVVFTSDGGARWAKDWTGWEQYDKLFDQIVRWSMRPVDDSEGFTVATDTKDSKVRVVVTALDKDDEFLNFLDMSGSIVGPNMEPLDLDIRQTAPGRYVGQFDATKSGSYFLAILPGPNRAPIRTGVNVPYSAEFSDRETNEALLASLASLAPKQGQRGKVIVGSLTGDLQQLLQTDTFRHNLAKAISSRDIWPMLMMLAACVFFADVFVRRVAINFDWVAPIVVAMRQKLSGAETEQPPDERLARLRSRKSEVGERIDERRAAARFEPAPEADVRTDILDQGSVSHGEKSRPVRGDDNRIASAEQEQEDSYTARLLKAKRDVWKDKDKGK